MEDLLAQCHLTSAWSWQAHKAAVAKIVTFPQVRETQRSEQAGNELRTMVILADWLA
jgi:hypothetical protein